MEALALHQIQLGKEIEKISKTYYDDSPDKKSLSYLKDKLTQIEDIWVKFNEGDIGIKKKCGSDRSHQYFTANYYMLVKNGYDQLKEELEKLIKIVDQHKKKQESIHSNDNVRGDITVNKGDTGTNIEGDEVKLIRGQKRAIGLLKNLLESIKSVSQIQTKEYYDVKRQSIQKYWEEISKNHKMIYECIEQPENYELEQYITIQEFYDEIMIKFAQEEKQIISRSQNEYNPQYNNNNIERVNQLTLKLPKIQLPKFDGNYLKWQQFYDLFNQMVHCQPMGNAQKMFYLKSNLVGEAERLIRHIPVTDENYLSAWELLINRYANKRLLVTALLDKLLSQPSVNVESAAVIKTLHDTTKECIVGLENLGLNIYNAWDPIILHILTRKLDRTTHTLYEQTLKAPRELQSLQKFLEFLELRFQSLEALGQKKFNNEKTQQTRSTVHTAITKNSLKCYFCSNSHQIYNCEKFLKLSPTERQTAAKKLNLCLNCLRQNHHTNKCVLKGCLKCNQRHNTLLHSLTTIKSDIKTSGIQEKDEKEASVNLGSTALKTEEESSYVFLGTATAFVLDSHGKPVKCRILLDSGSQVNLITERLKKKLKIPGTQDELKISGIGNAKVTSQDKIKLNVSSRISKCSMNIDAYVMKEITAYQP